MAVSISSTLTPKAENYVANAGNVSNMNRNTSATPAKPSAGIGISAAALYPTASTTVGYGLSASNSVVYYGNKTSSATPNASATPKLGVSSVGISASATPNVGASIKGINASATPKVGVNSVGISASATPNAGASINGINASTTPNASVTPKVGVSSVGINASATLNVGASIKGLNADTTVNASTTPKVGMSSLGINASKTVSTGVPAGSSSTVITGLNAGKTVSVDAGVGVSITGLNAGATVSAGITVGEDSSVVNESNINSALASSLATLDKFDESIIKPIIPNKVFADPPSRGEDILNTQGIIENAYNINQLEDLFQKGLDEVLSDNVSLSGTYKLGEIPVYTPLGTVTYYSELNVSESTDGEKLEISFDFSETIGELSDFLDSIGKDIVNKTALENQVAFNLSEGVKIYLDNDMSRHVVVKFSNGIGVDLNIDKLQNEIDVSLFNEKEIDDNVSITTGIHFELKNIDINPATETSYEIQEEPGIDVYLASNEANFMEELGELTVVCILGGIIGGTLGTTIPVAEYGLSELVKGVSVAFPKMTE